jgi:hypothetical protein
MATVIDQLIVTLGLDPTKFRKGSEEAERQTKATAETIRKQSEAMTRSLASVARQVAVLFVGFESASGLISFLGRLNMAQAALSRMALNLGINARALDVWDKKIELAGGSVQDAQGAIKQLNADINALVTTGQVSPLLVFFQKMGVGIQGLVGGTETAQEAFERLFSAMGKRPRATMFQLGTQAGLSEGLLSYGLRPPGEREEMSKEAERLSRTTEANARAADQLRERWVAIKDSLENIGIALLEKITPSLERMLPIVEKLALAFGDFIASFKTEDPQNFFKSLDQSANSLLATIKSVRVEIGKILSGDFSDVIDFAKSDLMAGLDRLNPMHMLDRIGSDPTGGWLGKLWDKTRDFMIGAQPYQKEFNAATDKYGLPAGLLRSIAQNESNFDPNAVSKKGAVGLMQLMPSLFPNAGKDPEKDIDSAAQYLKSLYKKFGSWPAAEAAYNAGPGRIEGVIEGTRTLPAETDRYVKSVNAEMRASRTASATAPPSQVTHVQIDSVTINTRATDGAQVAVDFMGEMKKRQLLIQSDSGILP